MATSSARLDTSICMSRALSHWYWAGCCWCQVAMWRRCRWRRWRFADLYAYEGADSVM